MSKKGVNHMEELKRLLPDKQKEVQTLERLIKLARQSPFAAASSDFLELQESTLTMKKMMVEVAESVLSCDKEE